MANEIFISYRRADAGWAGRIYDRLEDEFRPDDLFMDVESIAAGRDFDSAIRKLDRLLGILDAVARSD